MCKTTFKNKFRPATGHSPIGMTATHSILPGRVTRPMPRSSLSATKWMPFFSEKAFLDGSALISSSERPHVSSTVSLIMSVNECTQASRAPSEQQTEDGDGSAQNEHDAGVIRRQERDRVCTRRVSSCGEHNHKGAHPPTIAPHLPAAADIPWNVARAYVGNSCAHALASCIHLRGSNIYVLARTSEGRMKVVVLAPALDTKKVSP